MIKKFLVIAILIILITANISICYADDLNGVYVYNQNYSNINNGTLQTYNAYDLDMSTILYGIKHNLQTDNQQAFFSRYYSAKCHIDYTCDVYMRVGYKIMASNVTINDILCPGQPVFENGNENVSNYTAAISNFTSVVGAFQSGNAYIDYKFTLTMSFDVLLRDYLFNDEIANSEQYLKFEDNSSHFSYLLFNNSRQCIGYQIIVYQRTSGGRGYATLKYTLDNSITGVISGCFGHNMYVYDTYSGSDGFNAYGQYMGMEFNNLQASFNCKSIMSGFTNYYISEKSLVKSMNLYSYITGDFFSINTDFSDAYYSNASYDNNLYFIKLDILPPLFLTNDAPVVNPFDENRTLINVSYYDAKWYEFHKQAANAFIYMITEFPLISDITNLIYSLFVMIKNSFDVLLNFDGFGILFAFGMFAIVFGFIYKLITGD